MPIYLYGCPWLTSSSISASEYPLEHDHEDGGGGQFAAVNWRLFAGTTAATVSDSAAIDENSSKSSMSCSRHKEQETLT